MKRTTLTWTLFCAALLLVLGVMLYFTGRMLKFEKSMAEAEARAGLEEKVRLALWRMDSAAALMAPQKQRPAFASNAIANGPPAQSAYERLDIQSQNGLSKQEFDNRRTLNGIPIPDWRQIEPALLDRISDILPGAKLEAVTANDLAETDTRRLASIPARLVVPPDAMPSTALPWNTPVRISLMIAWACALLAAGAIAWLLGAAVSLGERRGAFAAAVTHELRTPVTTCRMYSEMLASGVVQNEQDRQHYLETLVAESDRLGHLIENVLAYSRLERRMSVNCQQSIGVSDLIAQILPSLRRRTEQAKLPLVVDLPEPVGGLSCRTDLTTVQQILLNLVENACKYGKAEIALSAAATASSLCLSVSDRGPGIDAARASRLFVAFDKSKTDTVPGIGLGLYLSRRLARQLGGDLQNVPTHSGATFVLSLPCGTDVA
jgi:signal transduction histidine kinase